MLDKDKFHIETADEQSLPRAALPCLSKVLCVDLKMSLELLWVEGLGFMSALLSFASGSSLIPKVLLWANES